MSGERHAPAPPLAPDLTAAPPAEDSVDIDIDGASLPPPKGTASTTPEPSPAGAGGASGAPGSTTASGSRAGGDTVRMSDTKRSVRPRMTLKIPDDEISRPQLTPSTPPTRVMPSESPPDASMAPIMATRIISIGVSAASSPPPPPVEAAPVPPVVANVAPSFPSSNAPVPGTLAPSKIPPRPSPSAAPGVITTREDSWTPYAPGTGLGTGAPPAVTASPSAIPPAGGVTSMREDSWTPYQPTVADLHPPVVHKAPVAKAPLKETLKEAGKVASIDPPTIPHEWMPGDVPGTSSGTPSTTPSTAPQTRTAKKSGDSADDIPIVTEVIETPDSAEPLELDEAISSLPPPPAHAYATPPAQPASSITQVATAAPITKMPSSSPMKAAPAVSPSSPAPSSAVASPSSSAALPASLAPLPSSFAPLPSSLAPLPATAAAIAPSPPAPPVTSPLASVPATAAASATSPTSSPAIVSQITAPPAMSGTLPINYIKDLPPMRSLAPTEPEGEEVRFDEEEAAPAAPRARSHSEPAEAAEISADDLVSIESAPSPSMKQPLIGTAPSVASPTSQAKPSARAASAGSSGTASAAAAKSGSAGGSRAAARVIVPSAGTSPLAPPPMSETAPAGRRRARPWWEELFNDDFIRTMAKISDEQISGESDFIEDSLAVAKGAMVLDLACGTGHHAIELTRRGYKVVGFDLSLPMLARAAEEAQERGQKLNFVQGDMREMTFEDTFDGVYCWNTSFGFFEEDRNQQVISRVHKALRKSGQFLLDVINRDYLIRQAPSLAWFEGEGCICMDEMSIDWITSRMRVKRTMMMDDGRTKEIEYSVRVYSLHELGKILHDSGFRVAEVSGRASTPGVFFGSESPRTLILAEKR